MEEDYGCFVCSHNQNGRCYYTKSKLIDTDNGGKDCLIFDYDCDLCKGEGFRHYGCPDCDLTEEEYYED